MKQTTSNKELLDAMSPEQRNEAIVAATNIILHKHVTCEYNNTSADGKRYYDVGIREKSRFASVRYEERDGKILAFGHQFKSEMHKYMYQAVKNGISRHICPMRGVLAMIKHKEYSKSLLMPPKVVKSLQVAPTKKLNLMDLDQAKKIFVTNYLRPLFRSQNKAFVFDNDNKKVLHDLICYFTRNESGRLDIYKGIFLYGPTGTGKSSLMYALSKFTKDYNLDSQFNHVEMEKIHQDIPTQGIAFMNKYNAKDVCIDEFGAKKYEKAYHYKNEIDVVSSLIQNRYNRYIKIQNQITHVTSNINMSLPTDTLLQYYENMDREISRIKGMFNFVNLSGIDRR